MGVLERIGQAIQEAWDRDPGLPPIELSPSEQARLADAALYSMDNLYVEGRLIWRQAFPGVYGLAGVIDPPSPSST